jgi:hypothetical protein
MILLSKVNIQLLRLPPVFFVAAHSLSEFIKNRTNLPTWEFSFFPKNHSSTDLCLGCARIIIRLWLPQCLLAGLNFLESVISAWIFGVAENQNRFATTLHHLRSGRLQNETSYTNVPPNNKTLTDHDSVVKIYNEAKQEMKIIMSIRMRIQRKRNSVHAQPRNLKHEERCVYIPITCPTRIRPRPMTTIKATPKHSACISRPQHQQHNTCPQPKSPS